MTSANNPSLFRHILVIEDQNSRRTISLEDARYSLGRHSSNSITIYAKQASRKHATLIRKTANQNNTYSFWILDGDLEGNKSHNGIFINGTKCLVHELKDGDLINFGCNVNASYHLLCGFSDTLFDREILKSNNHLAKTTSNGLAASPFHLEKTFFLSSSPAEISNNEKTFQEKSYQDTLTELPSRVLFHEYLLIALANARQNQSLMAVLFLDLEHFNQINDNLGYAVGDHVLKSFASRLKSCLRSGDIVGRWGGDEFAILLPHLSNTEDIAKISQRILNALKQPFQVENHQIYLRGKLGSALYLQDGEDAQTLLRKAEAASKQQGTINATLRRCNSSQVNINANTSQLAKVENQLYQALQHDEFSLYYQPQVNIKTGEVDGMEALLRWQHPRVGLIAPRQFIPWAEQTDLIIPISKWVLQTACRQNQAWQQAGLSPLSVSVNFSLRQFQQPYLLTMLAQTLSETGLDPHWLDLEITEKTILHNMNLARRVLHELQQMRVNVSIDDFGTGFSALSYLQELPFHQLKIDRSCVQKLQENPQDTAMIAAVIALGRSFNLRVVAEGVETQQQLELLKSLQCEEMQGYRFSQPLKAKEATQFLSLHRNPLRLME